MVVDDIFAVIAEPTRREILSALRSGDKAVGELVEDLQASQPTVSKHLRVLREAGLVTMRAQGQKRYYSLEREPLRAVQEWLGGLTPVTSPARPARQQTAGAPGSRVAPSSAPALQPAAAAFVQPEAEQAEHAGLEGGAVANTGQQLGRAASRAATRAAEVFANLPKLGRKK
ncbi:metalloregulator ArsR/SmtB family transcription factor [Arthrobacter sp. Y-9]|uniref:ArsR/SmtB family transcription factor n=1 Tax=Arthrobacter sp. Y-9 TaxID=3039385 RepID=UPI00241F8985|nr:metalloregulator ArsR/SmtB family transcription factor [Arthrobacter sp. Y-9]WFR83607.1 metalloregulator ArsR/SmtB family transcription factor [Arthrobacter sp. Y-9]